MIPTYIINFNRLTSTQNLVAYLRTVPDCKPIIIDNNSTYPPLLEWYGGDVPCAVIRLDQNVGKLAPWVRNIVQQIPEPYYCVTDSDLDLSEIPDDFLFVLQSGFKYDNVRKVGLGLRIDDLPDHFSLKKAFVNYQQQYWKKPVGETFFRADIDTTFAMYRSDINYMEGGWSTDRSLRTGGAYQARHLPWYVDLTNLNEEEYYYWFHCSNTSHSRDYYLETMAKHRGGVSKAKGSKYIVVDFDDFEDECTRWSELWRLKRINKNFKCTLFCIPNRVNRRALELLKQLDWVSPAVHGWDHSELECQYWTKQKALHVLDVCEQKGYDKIFRAPYWEPSQGMYEAIIERNWICADHHKNFIKRPLGLKVYDLDNTSEFRGVKRVAHGHLSPNSKNGIVECFPYFAGLNGEFKFISELFERNLVQSE